MKNFNFTPSLKLLLALFFGFAFSIANAQNPQFYLSSSNGSYSVIEGGTYSFDVNIYDVSTTDIVVNITTVADTANPSDYTPLTTTVTIPAGQLSYNTTLNIPTGNDAMIENNEYFYINATVTSGNTSNPSVSLPILIYDNDTIPEVSTSNAYLFNEPSSYQIAFYLNNYYSSNVVLHVTTTVGTAGTSDFTPINTTVTIPAGQNIGYATVTVADDILVEPDEAFTLTATVTSGNTSNPSAVSTITIRDNDTPPTLTFPTYNSNTLNTWEGSNLSFYAYLDRVYNSPVVFQVTTANGTAGSSDYTAITTTNTIPAGQIYVLITVPITDDSLDEPVENFTITGTITSGNTTNASTSATVNIIDNDGLPDFQIITDDDMTMSSVEEGRTGVFGIALTHPSNTATVVQISTANGTAGSLDYTPLTITATIPAGQTYLYSDSFAVPTILDQLQETNETFLVNATVTSGNTFNATASEVYTILDNYNLNAQEDTVTSVSMVGATFSLFANDTLHGLTLNTSDVNVTLGTNMLGVTVNAAGQITIPSGLAMGYYELTYTICEVANPTNCDTANILIEVASPLEATYNVSYSDYNGDGYTSVGDIISFQFNIKNNGNAAITNIAVDYMGGITVLGGPIATLNAGQTDSTTFTATHIVTQDDINFGFLTDATNQFLEIVFAGTYYGGVVSHWAEQANTFVFPTSDGMKLKAFVDTNTNGMQDAGENDFPLGHFNYQVNGGTIHNIYSTPFYLYESNPTTIYNLTYVVDSAYAANNVCSVSYPSATVAVVSGITTYNFPIIVTPYQDLSVNIHNYSAPPRPGFSYYSYITYTNNSNVSVPSGILTFTKDPAITTVVAVCDNNAVLTPTGFTYTFTNLLPYETRTFWIQMAVPTIPTVALGQLVTNTVSITLPAGDILPLNNTSSITQTIVGSYDPNEKTESHGGKIIQSSFTSSDYLTYTIKFENTGTANAINVKVSDILDDKLDETTIKMIDASHEYTLERVNKTLTWNFFGIDLLPSVDDTMIGHGYVVFQVKPKSGYVVGDVIPNSAEIYFDFNPAIVTDPCLTEFVLSLGTQTAAFQNFEFYPNPVKDYISLSNSATIDTVEITSVLGQIVKSIKVDDLQTQIDLSGLTRGVYFIKVTSEDQEKTIKIIKE